MLSSPHTPVSFDKHLGDLIEGLVIPGVGLTFLVLCAYAYAAWHPVSKDHLNRVSFRLLTYALLANLVFGVTFLSGTMFSAPSPRCNFVAFLVNFSLMFSAGMFCCMAINLELVLVHEVNGQKMEKYYILGTLIMCAACNITPYAAGQFGQVNTKCPRELSWNTLNETCWFSTPDQQAMVRWLIGTQSFWVLFMASVEVFAFLVIVVYVVSYELTTRSILSRSTNTFDDCHQDDWVPKSPVALYRNIILRIGLYPLVSCLMNFSTAILDLYQVQYQVKNPILTELNWRLNIADLAIYSIRPFIYSILAATDPGFIRAILALRRPVETHSIQQGVAFQFAIPTTSTGNLHIGLQPIETTTDVGGAKWNTTDQHSAMPAQTVTWESKHRPSVDASKVQTRSVGGLHSRRGSAGIDVPLVSAVREMVCRAAALLSQTLTVVYFSRTMQRRQTKLKP
ncbi:hypothetical protein FB451DRAFT_1178798 [Mycena latifolia]|nr:hypothetical protein FB451DRAFT_1178798 [Mycena latifolia]